MNIDEGQVREVVKQVLNGLAARSPETESVAGSYPDMAKAVSAANRGFVQLSSTSVDTRKAMIGKMRHAVLREVETLANMAVEETEMGRIDDKILKNRLAAEKTPGVEDVEPFASSDDYGLTLTERAPYGTVGAITPSTNPTESIVCNAIGMIAAGNSVVFNPHPGAKRCSAYTISLLRQAILEAGGPPDVVVTVDNPTIDTGTEMMNHPGIALLCVTGGPGVVKAAMQTNKRVIAAGPGNPPVVVDETADIRKAAADIVRGASFDNNIVCIDEKVALVVASVADALKHEMANMDAVELTQSQMDALSQIVVSDPGREGHEGAINKKYVGKDAIILAKLIGLAVPDSTRLLFGEVAPDHPLAWTEQLMPVLPMVRFFSAREAIDFAVRCEHGFRHTASIHSKNIDNMSFMAKMMNCSLFVKNGSNFNGMGAGGAGFTSYTIASPTGEGFTRPLTFTRERRCALIGSFRIV